MKSLFKQLVIFIIEKQSAAILKKYNPKIVAVTGSVGKTSTKDAIYTVLSSSYKTRKSEKSFNTPIGIPLTILGVPNAWSNPIGWLSNIWVGLDLLINTRPYPEYLVLEVGADRPGDIKHITKWLKPDVTVITKFGRIPVHVEFFKSKHEVVQEKGYLVGALKHDGTLIVNADDEDSYAFKQKFHNKVLSYGVTGEADVVASNYSVHYTPDVNGHEIPVGIQFKITHEGSVIPIRVNSCVGMTNVYSVLAGIAVGFSQGLNAIAIADALLKHETPIGRMKLIPGIKKTTILDDSYNASPVATEAALSALSELAGANHRIAVLGDMMELGKHSPEAHREVGKHVAKSVDKLITVGIRARGIAEGALDGGMSEKEILQFDNVAEAGPALQEMLQEYDIVLIKGSQSVRTEKLVKGVMAEPARAKALLVRQEEEWERR